jgi:hypothetical protein
VRNTYNIIAGKLKERDYLEDVGINERINRDVQ